MKRNNIRIAIIAFAVLVLIGAGAAGDSPAPDSAGQAVQNKVEVATFSVPNLSKELAKDISKALADEPGALSGKLDLERKAFLVAYDATKTSSMKIHEIMKTIAADTKLERVAPWQDKGGKHACGGCPNRDKCANYRK